MSVAAVTYTFAPNTLTKSSEANTNFADLVTYINSNAITKDAALAFTGVPSGPATDPTGDNHLARKAYVDKLGIVVQQVLTTSNGPHNVDTDTDMVLNNVSVVQGYTYAIHCHTSWDLVPGGGDAVWNVNLKVNGVVVDHFGKAIQTDSVQTFGELDGTVYWTAPATQATDDFVVAIDEVSGSWSLELLGSAVAKRTLTIVSLGKL